MPKGPSPFTSDPFEEFNEEAKVDMLLATMDKKTKPIAVEVMEEIVQIEKKHGPEG